MTLVDLLRETCSLANRMQLQINRTDGQAWRNKVYALNVPFWKALWDQAKRCTGIMEIFVKGNHPHIISEGGELWISLFTITERRLMHEITKEGWSTMGSDSEESEESISEESELQSHISLLKTAQKCLSHLQLKGRVRYHLPKLRFVLTRIHSCTAQKPMFIDVFNRLQKRGISVQFAEDLSTPRPISEVLPDMIYDEFSHLTPTINIDCTVLIAIVSDICNYRSVEKTSFRQKWAAQLKAEEENKNLLPRTYWPVMGAKPLVVTEPVFDHFWKLVNGIGTETEKTRMQIIFGQSPPSQDSLIEQFQKVSAYDVPSEWQLPIKIVPAVSIGDERLPVAAKKVAAALSLLNQAVFFYGWATGTSTITSNNQAVNKIKAMVEDCRTCEEDEGPSLWVCRTARSLAAKHPDLCVEYQPDFEARRCK